MRRIISVILTMSLCALILLSCAKENQSGEDNKSTGGDADPSAETTSVESELEYMGYGFPEVNYEGYEFKILNFEMQDWAYTAMAVEEEIGEAINDAIYTRNGIVEDKLNISIKDIRVPWGSMVTPLNNSVKAGTNEYDIAMINAYEAGSQSQKGIFLNLNDISSLNLDKPWWDQNAIKNLAIADKLYFTTTDASAFTYDLMCTLFFNKKMIEELGLENPYSLVLGNKWTMDKMLSMTREAAKDTDGDGIFTYSDIWGLSTHAVQDAHFFAGGKMNLIDKNQDGYPVLESPDSRFVSVYLKIREIFNLSNGVCISAGSNEGKIDGKTQALDSPEKFFMAGNALFLGQCLSIARMMRESYTDFGIIPHPKYDEAQDSYYSLMDGNFPTLTVPITQGNPEIVGVIMNALTAVSSTTLKPAYYDVSLNNKLVRDEDSIQMLDIELKNRVYDLAMIYGWGGLSDQFRQAAFSPSGENPLTVYEQYADKTQSAIDKMVNDFNKIN